MRRQVPIRNRILADLPRKEYSQILSGLAPVTLRSGQVLYEPGSVMHWAYFLDTAIASMLSVAEDGTSIEVSVVGDEGVIGIPIVLRTHGLPYKVIVQVLGTAWKMKADVLRKEFDRCGPLHKSVQLPAYLDSGVVSVERLQPVSQHPATPLSLAADIPGPRAIQRDPFHSRTPVADAGSQSRERQSSGQRLAKGRADQLPAWPDHHP